jgi:hypothetical protein
MNLETLAKIYAQGRNYINQILGAAVMFGVMTASQQKQVMDGLNDIWTGLTQAFTGASHVWQVAVIVLGPLIGGWLAKKAANSASTESQKNSLIARAEQPNGAGTAAKAAVLDATTRLPDVQIEGVIKASAEVASAVPSSQVQPQGTSHA